jgi:osmotically-inducible protein OsmY
MKVLSAVLGITLIVGMAACSTSDQRQAREQARETGHEISDEAKKAGHEIKRDAKKLDREVESGDAATIAKVKSKLAADAGLSTMASVEVDARGSVVTLSGTAGTAEQRKAAEAAASHVDGVTRVENHITVRP